MTIDEAYNTCFGKPYIVPIDKHEEAKSIIKKSLDEIRQYRELGTVEECRNSVLNIPKAYNKAIDDFVDKLKTKCDGMIKDKWNSNVAPISWAEAYADFKDDIDGIAKQLKAGGENA